MLERNPHKLPSMFFIEISKTIHDVVLCILEKLVLSGLQRCIFRTVLRGMLSKIVLKILGKIKGTLRDRKISKISLKTPVRNSNYSQERFLEYIIGMIIDEILSTNSRNNIAENKKESH